MYGDDWLGDRRTAQRRRAGLRKVGIKFASDLAPGVRVDVASILRAAYEAWEAAMPRASAAQVVPQARVHLPSTLHSTVAL